MNILTFDIEEWALAKVRGIGTADKYAEYDDLLSRILDLLDDRNFKATFFCTGLMAKDFPQVVQLIHNRGHEIGCHSNCHKWMNKMTESEAREDTHAAVDSIEQCIGEKVLSYRAPAFSIGPNNQWMFEILANEGITNDSSIYPAARDFGGFPSFNLKEPCNIKYEGVAMKEYPINLTVFLGKQMAYSGGGYFRFFPFRVIKEYMAKNDYNMCYFHINDLLPEKGGVRSKTEYEEYYNEPGTLKNRYFRYLKSNFGKKGAFLKLKRLMETQPFVNLEEAHMLVRWEKVPSVNLS